MKVEAGGTKHYYHQDSNYRIAALTDSTGAVSKRYIYTPYGQRIILDAAGTTVLPASAVANAKGH